MSAAAATRNGKGRQLYTTERRRRRCDRVAAAADAAGFHFPQIWNSYRRSPTWAGGRRRGQALTACVWVWVFACVCARAGVRDADCVCVCVWACVRACAIACVISCDCAWVCAFVRACVCARCAVPRTHQQLQLEGYSGVLEGYYRVLEGYSGVLEGYSGVRTSSCSSKRCESTART
jgi:hypothetical protein